MTTSDKVAAALTAGAVVSGTVGGFLVSAAAGFFVMSGLMLVVAVLLGLSPVGLEAGK